MAIASWATAMTVLSTGRAPFVRGELGVGGHVSTFPDRTARRDPVPSAGDGRRKEGPAVTGQADVGGGGGGHKGLVAAAYLARAGLSTVVCERRDVAGGAAVSEHPFGPEYTVTSLSYVVSLLPPDLVRDLRLGPHGSPV